MQLEIFKASTIDQIETVFAELAKNRTDALFVTADGFFIGRRVQLTTLATRNGLPASYSNRETVVAGGLMSYGALVSDNDRMRGAYVGRILKGEKAANLPVLQPVKFQLVINLSTAKALGVQVPPTLLAIADDVIE